MMVLTCDMTFPLHHFVPSSVSNLCCTRLLTSLVVPLGSSSTTPSMSWPSLSGCFTFCASSSGDNCLHFLLPSSPSSCTEKLYTFASLGFCSSMFFLNFSCALRRSNFSELLDQHVVHFAEVHSIRYYLLVGFWH